MMAASPIAQVLAVDQRTPSASAMALAALPNR
jgi:hypothetical protein